MEFNAVLYCCLMLKILYFSTYNSVKTENWCLYTWRLFSKVEPWADQWRGARERERGGDLNALEISNSCPCTVQTSLQYWASSQPGQLSKTGKGVQLWDWGRGTRGQGKKKKKKRKTTQWICNSSKRQKETTWERNKKKLKEKKRKKKETRCPSRKVQRLCSWSHSPLEGSVGPGGYSVLENKALSQASVVV